MNMRVKQGWLPWTYWLCHADDVERGTLCTMVSHEGYQWVAAVVADVERIDAAEDRGLVREILVRTIVGEEVRFYLHYQDSYPRWAMPRATMPGARPRDPAQAIAAALGADTIGRIPQSSDGRWLLVVGWQRRPDDSDGINLDEQPDADIATCVQCGKRGYGPGLTWPPGWGCLHGTLACCSLACAYAFERDQGRELNHDDYDPADPSMFREATR